MSIDTSPVPNYIPSGYKTLNVFLPVKNAPKALEWYNRAFGAEEIMRLTDPNGVVVHAEMKMSDTIFMLVEEDDRFSKSPASLGGTSVIMQLYVGDVDAFAETAISQGAEIVYPIENQFYGDRAGRIKDPFGHQWILSTHRESVTANEMQKRFNNFFS